MNPLHSMTAYGARHGTVPLILSLAIRWRSAVGFTLQLLCPLEIKPLVFIGVWAVSKPGLNNLAYRQVPCTCREHTPDFTVAQPLA